MRRLCAIAVALGVLAGSSCRGEPWPWGALILGRMDDGANDPRLANYLDDLRRVFGYRRYEIYGEAWGTGPASGESVVLPTKEFFVKLRPQGASRERVAFQFFRKEQLLVEGEAVMPVSSPLIITGPAYGHAKVILVVEIRDTAKRHAQGR